MSSGYNCGDQCIDSFIVLLESSNNIACFRQRKLERHWEVVLAVMEELVERCEKRHKLFK